MFDAARAPSMNDGGKRRYTDEAILAAFENPQRLHARPSDEEELDG